MSDSEIATRLSYFLWASAPDDELRQLAAAGKLHDPVVLAAQARRMLKDARVRRLATEFGCQWLHVRDVETLDEKSERHFPTFVSLREDMQEEVVRFFVDLFQNDRSVLSLLDADYTFVNGNLARHYALDFKGDEWQRMGGLRAQGRGGILGFAATLSKQSGASRTSAILRGTWLSEVILGKTPPPPPANVPAIEPNPPASPKATLRDKLEAHRNDANCSACHAKIDPLGLVWDNYDAVGQWRTHEKVGAGVGGDPLVNPSGAMPDGRAFKDAREFKKLLLADREKVARAFIEHLSTYALRRALAFDDHDDLNAIQAEAKKHDYRIKDIGRAVALSELMRKR